MTKIEHQLSNIVSKIIKASENMDFEDLKISDVQNFRALMKQSIFLEIAPKGNIFFHYMAFL